MKLAQVLDQIEYLTSKLSKLTQPTPDLLPQLEERVLEIKPLTQNFFSVFSELQRHLENILTLSEGLEKTQTVRQRVKKLLNLRNQLELDLESLLTLEFEEFDDESEPGTPRSNTLAKMLSLFSFCFCFCFSFFVFRRM